MLIALIVWRAETLLVGLCYGTHAADMLISTVLMYFIEGPISPFFLAVISVVLCAMFYWQWRGIVWPAVATLIVCLGLGVYAIRMLHEAAFALHTFVICGMYTVMVAILLRYLNAYYQPLLEHALLKARELLSDVQLLRVAEQHELRCLIQALRPSTAAALAETPFALTPHLERLGQRLDYLWGLGVDMFLEGLDRALPGALSQGLYLRIHEALINAAQHAGASSVCVALSVQGTSVHLMVRDNRCSCPFHEYYDLVALTVLSLGPHMLRERVASLGGDLTSDSAAAWAYLSITMPLGRPGAQKCQFTS